MKINLELKSKIFLKDGNETKEVSLHRIVEIKAWKDFYAYINDRYKYLYDKLYRQDNIESFYILIILGKFIAEIGCNNILDSKPYINYIYTNGYYGGNGFFSGDIISDTDLKFGIDYFDKEFYNYLLNYVIENIAKIPQKLYGYSEVIDCEHDGDIRRTLGEIYSSIKSAKLEQKYWDKEDCGEAWILYSFDKVDLKDALILIQDGCPHYFSPEGNPYQVTDSTGFLQYLINKYIR